jgi:antitoxin component YwqK of YwqJK toxin-antitoxin module
MKFFLSILFFLFILKISAQTRVDTIHCGNIIGYGKMVNGKKEGKWTWKSEDSTYSFSSYSGNYHTDIKNGEWIIESSIEDGFEKDVIHYKNNLLNGSVIVFVRGQLSLKGQYLNGLKNGEWDSYDLETGNIEETKYYQNGVPCGYWSIWENPGQTLSGQMTANGRNGYWILHDTIQFKDPNNSRIVLSKRVIIDSGLYVNGEKEGFWREYSFDDTLGNQGNYIHGKRNGRWTYSSAWVDKGQIFSQEEVRHYTEDLLNGNDTIWKNDTLSEINFYTSGENNGLQSFFNHGKLISQGISIKNPSDTNKEYSKNYVLIPIYRDIDLFENGLCNFRYCGFGIDYDMDISPKTFDSLLVLIKKPSYILDSTEYLTYTTGIFPTVRTGHWNFYYENGNKKEEGDYLPMVRDSVTWDSTNRVEDPNNLGTFVLAPIPIDVPTFLKTGWWKIYNEQGILIREERYDEKGELVETKKY